MSITEKGVDIEGALKTWLKANTDIVGEVSSRIFFAYPKGATTPLIVITLLDDPQLNAELPLQDPMVQFDVWGTGLNKAEASNVRKTLVGVLKSALPQMLDAETHLSGFYGIHSRWAPEPVSNQARYIVIASMTVSAV